ncbi:unnamed protein product [Diabrotica balteata]|uniref:Uncharacterized protein n=1 Tax=Diabrotica balteata TaxID=107213 RepID=A0A9N9XIT1_DIABA|nr:unnamed protein product [Diabrotica balteata]
MATKEDRSLGSGISIPQWMKTKSSKFDLDPSTFSPTELDDSFMLYYRRPKPESNFSTTTITTANLPENITVAAVTKKKQDFSQHPVPCQKYLRSGQDVPPQTSTEMKIKSPGTDDGFKGEAAKCGSSIIKVASQMISNQGLGLRTCYPEEPKEEKYDGSRRRNSKSLPASPLTSPGSSPKAHRRVNKYFTGAFTDVDKSKGSWILSNLYAKREISQSVGQIKEEVKEDLERTSSAVSLVEQQQQPIKTPPVYRAKPSELREMNFWSPTSM